MVIRLDLPHFHLSELEIVDQLVLERQNGVNRKRVANTSFDLQTKTFVSA